MAIHSSGEAGTSPDTLSFYVRAFSALDTEGISFLVGGAFALKHYADIERNTKDVDVFVREADCDRLLEVLGGTGCRIEHTFAHWLAKARCGEDYIDVIYSSGNAVCPVDDDWFTYAVPATVFGVPVRLSPPEEMIWQKAFIMERERFDGADVAHLLRALAPRLDWSRLLARFGPHWRVLLAHLVLFGFIYPGERDAIPDAVMEELTRRLETETASSPPPERVCQGTLLSRLQYEVDVRRWGYADARLLPRGNMTVQDAQRWVAAGEREQGIATATKRTRS